MQHFQKQYNFLDYDNKPLKFKYVLFYLRRNVCTAWLYLKLNKINILNLNGLKICFIGQKNREREIIVVFDVKNKIKFKLV